MSHVQEQPVRGTAGGAARRGAERAPAQPTGWAGWVVFGGMMMILLGSFQAMAGGVALLNSGYYQVGSNRLLVDLSYTAWGWTHLGLGVVALVTGFGLMTGALWARILGVVVAAISAVVNLGFLAAAPFWAVMMITLDIIVIYAITAHGAEVRNYQR